MLSSFSLISRDKNSLISIHPLVHAWARDRLICSEQESFWTLTASTIAISITWAFQTFDYRFRKSLVPHIDACLGFYDDGIFHLRESGQDCLYMAELLALTYGENGRRQEALQLLEIVVETNKRTLGEEHPNTLRSIHDLAISYGELGRRQEALQLLETVVEASKRTLGEKHPDMLTSMHNLTTMKESPNILTESSRGQLDSKKKPQTQHSDNKRTKQHSGMGRLCRKLI
jgi:tetratricopeptide (TPR) repeat protein